jgi:hypothetical protein
MHLILRLPENLACGQNRTTSATLRHYPGLTASPSVRYILGLEGRDVLSFRLSAVDGQVLVGPRAGTRRSPFGQLMQQPVRRRCAAATRAKAQNLYIERSRGFENPPPQTEVRGGTTEWREARRAGTRRSPLGQLMQSPVRRRCAAATRAKAQNLYIERSRGFENPPPQAEVRGWHNRVA